MDEPKVENESTSLLDNIEYLCPINNAQSSKTYSKAIKKALDNKDVKNIALSGPYGSGKSSVINTFTSEYPLSGPFLEVSLANFDEKKLGQPDAESEIEKSILQQMFYSVNKDDIPLSRLKRIVVPNKWSNFWSASYFSLFIVTVYFIINLDLYKKFATFDNTGALLYITFIVLMFFGFFRIAPRLKNIRLNKFIIKDAEFDLSEDDEKMSLINRHLDEILYFFESTSYKVLIIEDLDRYQNVSIFEKLRELNALINRSRNPTESVTFIYAVKDDFFTGENRSKFFDVIIPVIPFVNAAGSGRDLLVKKFKAAKLDDTVQPSLLKEIALFISDYRLLINIFNEFLVYLSEHQRLSSEQNNHDGSDSDASMSKEKLFCMIVYKNFFPEDFAQLHRREGMIYDIFSTSKDKIRINIEKSLKEKITNIEMKIGEIEDEKAIDKSEIKLKYMYKLLSSEEHQIIALILNNRMLSVIKVINDETLFEQFLKSSNILARNENNQQVNWSIPHDIDGFNKSLSLIEQKTNGTKKKLNDERVQLQTKQRRLKHYKLKELIDEYGEGDVFADLDESNFSKQKDKGTKNVPALDLLKSFIRSGHIDEEYSSFISYYHSDGALSGADQEFFKNVISGIAQPFDIDIGNIPVLLDDLRPEHFMNEAALNIAMTGYIFEHYERYPDQSEYILEQLFNKNEVAKSFLPDFFEKSRDICIGQFVAFAAKRNKWFWMQIEDLDLDQEQIHSILMVFFMSSEKQDIIAQGDAFTNALFGYEDLLNGLETIQLNISTLKDVISGLNGSFNALNAPMGEKGRNVLEHIYEKGKYAINMNMLQLITEHLSDDKELYKGTADYSAIMESDLKYLKEKISLNVDIYVHDVFFPMLEENKIEKVQSNIALLNHPELDDNLKLSIIRRMNVFIDDIETISKSEWSFLFKQGKVIASWTNVITYYRENDNTFDDNLSEYLMMDSVYKILHEQQIDSVCDDKDFLVEFYNKLALDTLIKGEPLKSYRSCMDYLSAPDIENASFEKLEELIDYKFLEVTQANYIAIRNRTDMGKPPLHIRLIERDFSLALKFINDAYEFTFEIEDIIGSKKISDAEKMVFISGLSTEDLEPHVTVKGLVETVFRACKTMTCKLDLSMLLYILEQDVSAEQKVDFLIQQEGNVDNGKLIEMLRKLGRPYSNLLPGNRGKRSLPNTQQNAHLCKILKSRKLIGKWDAYSTTIEVNRLTTFHL